MTDKPMTPAEVVARCQRVATTDAAVGIIAARDAALVAQALRDAVGRYRALRKRALNDFYGPDDVETAIMGTPPLVKGMVVRHKGVGGVTVWLGLAGSKPEHYEPVKGHADADGNLFVDEEE